MINHSDKNYFRSSRSKNRSRGVNNESRNKSRGDGSYRSRSSANISYCDASCGERSRSHGNRVSQSSSASGNINVEENADEPFDMVRLDKYFST